jgi:3-oxoacyl-[acyl-carrier protein] reductase
MSELMPEKPNALITGGTKGIGRAVAMKLASAGYHVLANYHSDDVAAQETAEIIQKQGGSCELLKFDVGNPEEVAKSLAPILEKNERAIDVLVNNAGVTADTAMVWMTEKNWKEVLSTNLYSFFYVTKPVVKRMVLQRKGRIVSIASIAGQTGSRGQVNYSASKGGIIAASKSLAVEVAARNITVNVVAPGFIDTEMLKGLSLEKILPYIPMKRLGRPEEVASAVLFLISPESSYITGQVLAINGGMYT